MRKIYFALCVLVLFLVSCTAQEGTERGFFGGGTQKKVEGAFTGLKGIELSLDNPGPAKVAQGDSFIFDLRVDNLGWYPTTVNLYLSGFDPAFLTYDKTNAEVQLNGKSGIAEAIIPGDWQIVRFQSTKVSSPGQIFPQNTVITACYPYRTELTYSTCVDGDGDGKCVLAVSNAQLSLGQGAPLAVDSVTSASTRKSANMVRVSYTIAFSQKDSSAQLVSTEKVNEPCNGRPLDQYRDYNIVKIEDVKLGDAALQCLPQGSINLAYQKTITCYADISSRADYATAIVAKASYGMIKQITKPVTIVSTY